MLAEFPLNQAFTTAWFGLMTIVWLGWAQEAPSPRLRGLLGAGSVVGIALAALFGYAVYARWSDGSVLAGREAWFGVLVAVEVVVAGVGAVILARRGQGRWAAWWVALTVALHFIPLGLAILGDWSVAALGIVQTVGLLLLIGPLRRREGPTSAVVGPFMGATLFVFALAGAAVYVARWGWPWVN